MSGGMLQHCMVIRCVAVQGQAMSLLRGQPAPGKYFIAHLYCLMTPCIAVCTQQLLRWSAGQRGHDSAA